MNYIGKLCFPKTWREMQIAPPTEVATMKAETLCRYIDKKFNIQPNEVECCLLEGMSVRYITDCAIVDIIIDNDGDIFACVYHRNEDLILEGFNVIAFNLSRLRPYLS